jgi:hypothetical protein
MRIRSALGQGTTVVVRWPINGQVGGLTPTTAAETVLQDSSTQISGG